MRKILILSFLSLILHNCINESSPNNAIMAPQLSRILTEYIESNPDDSLYLLIFSNQNNKQFFTLQRSDKYYNKDFVDGCFSMNGKIVIFWELNRTWKDSVLYISPDESNQFRLLEKYKTWDEVHMDYDRSYNPITYEIKRINNKNGIFNASMAFDSPAKSTNVINSKNLNRIINNYLKTCQDPDITIMRFNSLNGYDYVTLSWDYFIDKELFSGAFYRDGRLVIVYSAEKLINKDIINTNELLPIFNFSDYKFLHREYARYPESKYRFVSKDSLEEVEWDEENMMVI